MKHKIFTIFDVKAGAYLPPFFMHAEGMAIRAFTDCIRAPDHQFNKHPQDYTLFHIGEFSDQDALVVHYPPVSLGNGIEFVDLAATADIDHVTQVGNKHAIGNGTPVLTDPEC